MLMTSDPIAGHIGQQKLGQAARRVTDQIIAHGFGVQTREWEVTCPKLSGQGSNRILIWKGT